MKNLFVGFCAIALLTLSLATSGLAAEPADSVIKGVLYDVDRAEKQIPSLTPNRKPNIKRIKRALGQAAEKLQQSPNKDHESWKDAEARLNKAMAAINDLEAGRMPGAAAAAPEKKEAPAAKAATTQQPQKQQNTQTQSQPAQSAQPAAKSDPNVARAGRDIARMAQQVKSMRMGDRGRAERFLGQLQQTAGLLHNAPDKETDEWKQAAADFANLRNQLIHHMAVAYDKEFSKVIDFIDRMQPLQYLIAKDVGYVKKTTSALWENLAALQAKDHPSVQAAQKRITAVAEEFKKREANAKAQHAELGDVKTNLAAILKRTREIDVPDGLQGDITEADILAYVAGVKKLRQHIAEDLPYLQKINGKTPMTVEEGNKFRHALYLLSGGKPQDLERSLFQTNHAIDARVTQHDHMRELLDKADPNDVNDQANKFVGEGLYEEYVARYEEIDKAIELARVYDEGIGRTDAPDRDQQAQTNQQSLANYNDKYIQALDLVRMPEAKSTDQALLDAAAEILTGPKNNHEFERMVINYGPHHREKKSGSIEGGTVSATVTVYTYIWDEFQTTTAEKVGDHYYLFSNSFRYYTSGGERTTLNKWIMNRRFKGRRILEENIHK